MSYNPLNELKRRLEDQDTPLPKRLCLAKNVILSHHFPSAPKERLVADWLQALIQKNKLYSKDLRNIVGWLNTSEELTSELKSKLVKVVSQFLQGNPLQKGDVISVLTFLENTKLTSQLSLDVEESLQICVTLLQYLKADGTESCKKNSTKIFSIIVKLYKESKKKLDFIVKLIDGENLETIFSYLDTDRDIVVMVCKNILFPMNKKSFFASYLQTLVRKDNLNDLLAEKGDNIQSVLKIMETFFAFPKRRTSNDHKFLSEFIDVFVTCFGKESQMIFAFYVMVTNCLNMYQNYLSPEMNMSQVNFNENSEKIKRNIFLDMLLIILKNEVDINVRLTDTLGVKIAKVETKKTFLLFLEAVMMGQLKLKGKPDKATFQIIKTALKLDPSLIEQKLNVILPPLMAIKKNSITYESYVEMINYLLETLFKLSRGSVFINQLLPFVKGSLESINGEQIEYIQKMKEAMDSGKDFEKLQNKVIIGTDVFPNECVHLYGKLTSELMFRQNKDLLMSLQKDLEEHCLQNLKKGDISPSTLTLTEVVFTILSTFLSYSKMVDHTVPLHIAEEFWASYKHFETVCLKKFGKCVLKICNPRLTIAFLNLCLSCSQMKLLNIKYSNQKLDIPQESSSDVFDLHMILPCLSNDEWTQLVTKVDSAEALVILDEILTTKTMIIQVISQTNSNLTVDIDPTKTHLIQEIARNPNILKPSMSISKLVFTNLDRSQLKNVAKTIVKSYLNNPDLELLNSDSIQSNKLLLSALVLETAKHICKCFNNTDSLAKAIGKTKFDFATYAKETDMKDYFNAISIKDSNEDDTLSHCLEILKHLQIYYLEEIYQLITIFVLLVIKKNCQKKLRKNADYVMQGIFELCTQTPDLYKIFAVEFIFSFNDKLLLDLLTLKIKTSNNQLVIKRLLESAVKRVKVQMDLIKSIGNLLINKLTNLNSSSMDFFSDPSFQISCIILPLIIKHKKSVLKSEHRSILTDLQEKLHKAFLECFKNINFDGNSNFSVEDTANTDESIVVSESTMATLNAISAYTLTLSKYCETTDREEMKNLEFLWSGLDYFVQSSIKALQYPSSKLQHVESSMQLLTTVLRYIKKLETHDIFRTKDKLFLQIWDSVKARLLMIFDETSNRKQVHNVCLEAVPMIVKYLCELVSVEGFVNRFVEDFDKLAHLENPAKLSKIGEKSNALLTSHKVSKYLWAQILKANIVGPKCTAITKLIYRLSKNLKNYIQQHYENEQTVVVVKSKRKKLMMEFQNEEDEDIEVKSVKADDIICEMLKVGLDTISEGILSAKKVNLDYKFLDCIFELQHSVYYIIGLNTSRARCEVSWRAFFMLFEGSTAVLNCLLVAREELLEDRWPCFMQCYRSLVSCICSKSSSNEQLERDVEERLGEMAHSIEKLTQSICKRKSQVSKIAAYSVGDICSFLERSVPSRTVRQHLENSTALLIQAADTTHAMAFLRRALAGSPGQMTMTNMYTMYKRYHKYVGNA